ncbi:MAG: glycosyltransferase family 39 protein [Puniceicoccales bacterium]|jgi:4-amino-4-deoxy-L-arabinose transferase-like glycosyltransferase|nr:glycosyltransferase family 39 protein [Puniceicoccales bacterium]
MKKWSGCLVFALLTVLFFWQIAFRPLANPDEGRYAEIAREMLVSGDWITPRLNGILYFEKPPFVYWCTAMGQRIFGENLWGVRFFNALLTLLTCLSVYRFCAHFFNRKVGTIAAGLLGTSALMFGMSQVLTLDGTLGFFVTATLLSFAWGFLETDNRSAQRHFWLAYIFMALAILTKGLIGIVFPAFIGIPWLIYTGYWRKMRQAHIAWGLLLVLLINFPWHYAIATKHAIFCKFYFWHEHFERYFLPTHNRMKPFYFLLVSFLVGLIPWTFFLPRALILSFKSVKEKTRRNILVFGCLWSVSLITFFSRSQSQLIPYVLPAIPGIIFPLAYAFSTPHFLQQCRIEYFVWATAFLITSYFLPSIVAKRALEPLPQFALVSIELVLIAGSLGALACLKKSPKLSFSFLTTTMCGIYFMLPLFFPYFQRLNASWVSQVILQSSEKPSIIYCAYEYFQDLPFYLKQVVGIVDHVPGEQLLGYQLEGCDRYISQEQLVHLWTSEKTIYAVVRRRNKEDFEKKITHMPFYILTQDLHFILYSNHL